MCEVRTLLYLSSTKEGEENRLDHGDAGCRYDLSLSSVSGVNCFKGVSFNDD